MRKRIPAVIVLSFTLVAFLAMAALAAKAPQLQRSTDDRVERVPYYSFPDAHYDHLTQSSKGPVPEGRALGAFVPSASPGTDIGDTWYEY